MVNCRRCSYVTATAKPRQQHPISSVTAATCEEFDASAHPGAILLKDAASSRTAIAAFVDAPSAVVVSRSGPPFFLSTTLALSWAANRQGECHPRREDA
jgi:hypothetical protein